MLPQVNVLLGDPRVEVRENAALVFAGITDTREGVTMCVENDSIPALVIPLPF